MHRLAELKWNCDSRLDIQDATCDNPAELSVAFGLATASAHLRDHDLDTVVFSWALIHASIQTPLGFGPPFGPEDPHAAICTLGRYSFCSSWDEEAHTLGCTDACEARRLMRRTVGSSSPHQHQMLFIGQT